MSRTGRPDFFRFLGDFGGLVVADSGVEQGGERDALVDEEGAAFAVDDDALEVLFGGGVHRVGQPFHGVEQRAAQRRHHHVELHLPGLHHVGHGGILSQHLETHLVQHFEHHRIDLAGHDGRARLHRRQLDFAQARARAGSEQTQIVGDAGEFQREVTDFAR